MVGAANTQKTVPILFDGRGNNNLRSVDPFGITSSNVFDPLARMRPREPFIVDGTTSARTSKFDRDGQRASVRVTDDTRKIRFFNSSSFSDMYVV